VFKTGAIPIADQSANRYHTRMDPAATTSRTSSWRAIVQAVRPLVPVIEAPGGIGAGLLVRRDGLIVTNRHVVDGGSEFMVRFHDGTKAKAVIVHRSAERDLAMIRAGTHAPRCFDIARDIADQPEAGDDVLAIGHPRGLSFTSTRGIVSEPRRRIAEDIYVQVDVPINPGNSGGPLLDAWGRLVGLTTFIHRGGHGLSFAIPTADVQAYVLSCFMQLDGGLILFPADEQISHSQPHVTPHELIAGAVRSSGLAWRQHDASSQLIVTSPAGHEFWVSMAASCLLIHHYIGELGPHRRDAGFLFDLLKVNFSLNGPTFQIDVNDALCLAYNRPLEGLDMNEARTSLFAFADALDEHLPDVRRRLAC
jgi:S1-C subfamily serine protease